MQALWMLLASLFFSLMAACTKWGAVDYGAFALVFYRSAVGCAAIAGWALASGKSLATTVPWGHFKRCLIGTLALWIWFWSLGRLPLETGMTLNYTSGLFMALFVTAAALRRGLRPDWAMLAAVAAGFAGVLTIMRPSVASGESLALAAGLSSGFLSALAYLQIRELNSIREPAWRIVFYFTLFGTLFGLAGALLTEPGGVAFTPTTRGVCAVFGTGLFGLAGQMCLTKAFAGGSLLLVSVLQYSALVFSALIGAAAFGDRITPATVLGIAVIVASGSVATILTGKHFGSLPAKGK